MGTTVPVVGALARRATSWLRVVTYTGWSVLASVAGAAALSLVLGWQEATYVMTVLLVVAATAVLWLLPRGGHAVEHELMEPRVTVGDRAVIHVTVSNPTRGLLMPTRMEMRVGDGRAVFVVPALVPDGTNERGFVLPTRRRGVVPVGPVLTVDQDPIGLLRRERRRTEEQTVHVHPRTVALGAVLHGTMRDVEGAVTEDLSSSDVSFHALRDYVAGDDRRNVHWRTTARTGRLMVRQFEETRRASLAVLLSTREEDYDGPDDFETAVSVACSLALDALAANREVHVVTQDGVLPTTSAQRLLDASCTLTTGEHETCDELARQVSRAHPDLSVMAVVTGQACENVLLARARILTPPSVAAMAVGCGARAQGRSHIGGMPVVEVRSVEDLPRVLRGVVAR